MGLPGADGDELCEFIRLPEDTPFKQRVYYRTGDTSGMTPKQKKAFDALRKRYALPVRGAIDRRLTLDERDAAMRAYVARRFAEAGGSGQ